MTCTPECRAPTPSQAHCGACHLTMATVTDFNHHRRDGRCLHPALVGLVAVDDLWGTPEGHHNRTRLGARLAQARERRSGDTPGATNTPGPRGR